MSDHLYPTSLVDAAPVGTTIRCVLSSMFADLQTERDVVQERVFPQVACAQARHCPEEGDEGRYREESRSARPRNCATRSARRRAQGTKRSDMAERNRQRALACRAAEDPPQIEQLPML